MTKASAAALSDMLLKWYAHHGRAHLPWRETRDAYRILVSEFMLQQTQVDRALPKYEAFVERFPSVAALAAASQSYVLRLWQGLGYNSRAVRLHALAKVVMQRFGGRIPSELPALVDLPGIGSYTAAALRAFAFECDEPAMDTNIRRVVHRWLLGIEYPPLASAADLDQMARRLIPAGRGHDWNSAMMDLGATICKARTPDCARCPIRARCAAAPVNVAALNEARARHGRKPSPQEALSFPKTTRFARGRIVDRLRALPLGENISFLDLHRDLQGALHERSVEDITGIVRSLERDGLVAVLPSGVRLRD